ncbi:hypothetical protein K2Z83_11215 [Oscillochloris sp. ZM17-4]|uniref:hypothetical protein n=1 Tax=Oscillochloris sp. ZM17-4 TaxID=2866714 RepID=UPI001C739DF9|nr:hypothetical protein [Oscillochloris sp. ZM17-4]MBX0328246.1 hypothetical protein [Oscillochloris sp. ZM17-4]
MAKTRGGREVVDLLVTYLDWIDEASNLSRSDVLFDPERAYAALVRVGDQTAALRQLIRQRLEPMLERTARNAATAALPDRVAALEAELASLRAQLDGQGRVIPLRKVE